MLSFQHHTSTGLETIDFPQVRLRVCRRKKKPGIEPGFGFLQGGMD
jgi:hypothetical protein